MPISIEKIQSAINEHGAQAVLEAAKKQMAGDTDQFAAMGFIPESMGCVYKVMTVAYEQMGEAARAIDYAKTQAELTELISRHS